MPPKRPFSNNNDYHSPPPGHRPTLANEHHLSPIHGHHPETPADAPVAITTPPRSNNRNYENLSPTIGNSPEHIQERGAVEINFSSRPATAAAADVAATEITGAMQNSPEVAMEPGAVGAGGARAAYHATQQQRIVTCNLNSMSPSENLLLQHGDN